MQFVESPGDNLLLLASCSAPFSRALGRQPKHTRVEGADTVMPSLGAKKKPQSPVCRALLITLHRSWETLDVPLRSAESCEPQRSDHG